MLKNLNLMLRIGDIKMLIATIMFYVFSVIAVLSALAVISVKNPVYSVLFLILSFFNAAGLFVLMGAEFLAMLLVIVYVGAVAVLFLFVVMMLNINFAKMKEGLLHYLPIGLLVATTLFAELFFVLSSSAKKLAIEKPTDVTEKITNTEAIGRVLYTDYAYLFQISGLILLIAMIGAIVLTHRNREGVRKQDINSQLSRSRKDTIMVVNVEKGRGI